MPIPSSSDSCISESAAVVLQSLHPFAVPSEQSRTTPGIQVEDKVWGGAASAPAESDTAAEAPLEGCAYCGDDVPNADTEYCSTECARLAPPED